VKFPQLSDLNALQNISQLDLDKLDLSGVVIPIPQINFGNPPPELVGNPAIVNPFPAKPVPQSPFMAPNGLSGVHLDAYQSDTYTFGTVVSPKSDLDSGGTGEDLGAPNEMRGFFAPLRMTSLNCF
jgi:hypothetical protein